MSKFAKLFDVGADQVLIFIEYDSSVDETVVHQITSIDGPRVDLKLVFSGDTQSEQAKRCLAAIELEDAHRIHSTVNGLLNG